MYNFVFKSSRILNEWFRVSIVKSQTWNTGEFLDLSSTCQTWNLGKFIF